MFSVEKPGYLGMCSGQSESKLTVTLKNIHQHNLFFHENYRFLPMLFNCFKTGLFKINENNYIIRWLYSDLNMLITNSTFHLQFFFY